MNNFYLVPNQKDHYCFGCSPINPYGLQLKFYSDNSIVFTKTTVPQHLCGWSNVVHGGVLATIIDETMAWTGIYLLQKYILTKSIQVDYLKPLKVQEEIYSRGSLLSSDKRTAEISVELFNSKDELSCTGRGVLRVYTPEEMRKFKLMDEEYLNSFEQQVFNHTMKEV
jgi:uncharacterized protein (TIGR00369 family)